MSLKGPFGHRLAGRGPLQQQAGSCKNLAFPTGKVVFSLSNGPLDRWIKSEYLFTRMVSVWYAFVAPEVAFGVPIDRYLGTPPLP